MTNVFSELAELRRELVVVSAVLRCEGRVFAVKGESSMLLVTYCCAFSYGDVGPLPRLVPVALAHLPLGLRYVPGRSLFLRRSSLKLSERLKLRTTHMPCVQKIHKTYKHHFPWSFFVQIFFVQVVHYRCCLCPNRFHLFIFACNNQRKRRSILCASKLSICVANNGTRRF